MSVQRLKRVLVGRPIPTSLDQHERLSRVTGLAVVASDALSSVAYATEAILLVLVAAGTGALGASLPIALAIAVLVAIVVTSFRQSILAYPRGGGDVGPAVGAAAAPPRGMEALTLFLALRAFASGCAALTGIEAVSDGVPAFRTPEAQNARQVLAALGLILIVLFVGITFLVYVFHVVPVAGETTNSQLARLVFGQSPLYYLVQGVTALILVLAANTSFADFPRVASFLARDGFVPRQFANRGDRLAYSNGILILTVLRSPSCPSRT